MLNDKTVIIAILEIYSSLPDSMFQKILTPDFLLVVCDSKTKPLLLTLLARRGYIAPRIIQHFYQIGDYNSWQVSMV